jgi:hypothetical protein
MSIGHIYYSAANVFQIIQIWSQENIRLTFCVVTIQQTSTERDMFVTEVSVLWGREHH